VNREVVDPPQDEVVPAGQTDAVVDATRVVGALIAESLASVEPPVTVSQWRVLVLASEGSCNVSAVADDLGVHPSNATRICDRLVSAGFLSRQKDAVDRRHVRLTLTAEGADLFESAMSYRRDRVEHAMAHIDPEKRAVVAEGVVEFAAALDAVRRHASQ